MSGEEPEAKSSSLERILGQIEAVRMDTEVLQIRLGNVDIAINRLWQVWEALHLEPDAKKIKDDLVNAMDGLWELRKRLKLQLERTRAKLHELQAQLEVLSA